MNRSLLDEYGGWLATREWDVCLLQECPPAWAAPLSRRCRANGYRVLTSRNQLGPLRRAFGRWNPDLIGANEGGSNLTLVRAPWKIVEKHSLLLNPLPQRGFDERRRLGFVRLRNGGAEICVTNLHASAGNEPAAERELRRAARYATDWAHGAPLLLAGDFNLRPHSSRLFDELAGSYELLGITSPSAIDHVLHRRVEPSRPTVQLSAADRELEVATPAGPRRLRLSDHSPLEVSFPVPAGNMASMRYK